MAQDTENRIDGQIESASKPQRWNKRLIAIGGIGSSLLIGVPIIGYYINKRENQITAGVFPDFSRESRLDDGVFGNPNSYY